MAQADYFFLICLFIALAKGINGTKKIRSALYSIIECILVIVFADRLFALYLELILNGLHLPIIS
jgi:hypothetical protein